MAAGDFTVALDGAGQNNVTTLPTSDAAGKVIWLPSQAETNADTVTLLADDVLGAQWEPLTISFDTRDATAILLYLDAAITAIPASVWAHGVRTLTSFGTLVADIALAVWTYATRTLTSFGTLVAAIWSYSSRTLTMALPLIKSMLLGTRIEFLRGDTLDLDFTRLGNIAAIDDIWFTFKQRLGDTDATAMLQVSLDYGLLAIAGTAVTTPAQAANGVITVIDPVTGHITVYVEAEEMAKLTTDFTGYWDIQTLTGTVVTTLTRGNGAVIGDTTRRII